MPNTKSSGRKSWETPNLDRLAAQGTRFTRWYSGAVVCAPSRGCLLTGKYTFHNGLKKNNDDLPAEEVTIAEALKPLGYDTALIGTSRAAMLYHNRESVAMSGYTADLFPSFVAAAGGEAMKVDGRNMLPVFEGNAKPPERTLFWEWQQGDMLAAMRGDFKLLEIGGQKFLYNVAEDPGERRTLAAEYPEIFQQLQAELKDWPNTEIKR